MEEERIEDEIPKLPMDDKLIEILKKAHIPNLSWSDLKKGENQTIDPTGLTLVHNANTPTYETAVTSIQLTCPEGKKGVQVIWLQFT